MFREAVAGQMSVVGSELIPAEIRGGIAECLDWNASRLMGLSEIIRITIRCTSRWHKHAECGVEDKFNETTFDGDGTNEEKVVQCLR